MGPRAVYIHVCYIFLEERSIIIIIFSISDQLLQVALYVCISYLPVS